MVLHPFLGFGERGGVSRIFAAFVHVDMVQLVGYVFSDFGEVLLV